MKALVVTSSRQFGEAEHPTPVLRDGYALVKVAYGAICGSDRISWENPAPNCPGHEFSGIVEDPGTTGFKKGDRVCAPEINPCGECEFCKAGKHNLCPSMTTYSVGMDIDGAYSEYVPVRGERLHKLPDDYPLELGALAEPLAVSLHGVHRLGFEPGNKLLIWGNGPIGIFAALYAKKHGASEIYMVGRGQGRVDFCNRLGYVDACFSVNDSEFDAKLAAVSPENGFEYVIDALGSPDAFDQILTKTKPDGKVALLGLHSFSVNFSALLLLGKEINLIPSWFFTLEEYDEAVKFIGENREEVERLITSRIPHNKDAVQQMFEKLFVSGKNDECKVIIDYSL